MRLNYFAFGSNLSSLRLLQRLPEASIHCVATLAQHQLRWHKKSHDLSGKCNIDATGDPADCVYGVVYRMDVDDRKTLDVIEGHGIGYERREVEVLTLAGDRIESFTYYAIDIDTARRPYHWYKEHVLRGALEHGFPERYVAQIRATLSIDDHDSERHARELAIYGDSGWNASR